MLSSCCQLTGMEQSNPRSELSFPGIHIPSPKHPFTMSVWKVTFFFLEASFLRRQDIPSFLPTQRRACCCTVGGKKKRKKAFRSSTPAPQHTAPRSHLAVCQAASVIPSSTAKWHFSQKKKPIIFGKKDTVSTDGCCMLATSHAADHSEMCAAHA